MMLFTLDMLRLMRDYNGRILPAVPAPRTFQPPRVKACHTRQIEYFSHRVLVCNEIFVQDLKKIICHTKNGSVICISCVYISELPITVTINHMVMSQFNLHPFVISRALRRAAAPIRIKLMIINS